MLFLINCKLTADIMIFGRRMCSEFRLVAFRRSISLAKQLPAYHRRTTSDILAITFTQYNSDSKVHMIKLSWPRILETRWALILIQFRGVHTFIHCTNHSHSSYHSINCGQNHSKQLSNVGAKHQCHKKRLYLNMRWLERFLLWFATNLLNESRATKMEWVQSLMIWFHFHN